MARDRLDPIEKVFKDLIGEAPRYKENNRFYYTGLRPIANRDFATVKISRHKRPPYCHTLTISDGDTTIRISKERGKRLSKGDKAHIAPYLD